METACFGFIIVMDHLGLIPKSHMQRDLFKSLLHLYCTITATSPLRSTHVTSYRRVVERGGRGVYLPQV